MVEAQKNLGNLASDFHVEVISLAGLPNHPPNGTMLLTCLHGRRYLVRWLRRKRR